MKHQSTKIEKQQAYRLLKIELVWQKPKRRTKKLFYSQKYNQWIYTYVRPSWFSRVLTKSARIVFRGWLKNAPGSP